MNLNDEKGDTMGYQEFDIVVSKVTGHIYAVVSDTAEGIRCVSDGQEEIFQVDEIVFVFRPNKVYENWGGLECFECCLATSEVIGQLSGDVGRMLGEVAGLQRQLLSLNPADAGKLSSIKDRIELLIQEIAWHQRVNANASAIIELARQKALELNVVEENEAAELYFQQLEWLAPLMTGVSDNSGTSYKRKKFSL